ncbi:MAG TPA: hypothetical protein VHT70_03440 [Candidatus Saccharimonadales bacterium]|jgi:hypothetical protein|nr:hypothetical protein [Candidatus Saccharimonadales bacterium]
MKAAIWIGATIGGLLGGWLGSLIDHSALGLWGLLFGTVGGIIGIWAGYKIGKNYL